MIHLFVQSEVSWCIYLYCYQLSFITQRLTNSRDPLNALSIQLETLICVDKAETGERLGINWA